jgi:carbamoyltransferase
MSYFEYQRGAPLYVSDKFIGRFGVPRRPDEEIADHHRAVARALQQQTEEVVLDLARWVRRESGLSRLVMAGGVALNCVANGRILTEGVFDDVFIQPAAGDNGACLGAALFVSHRKLGLPRGEAVGHAFHGPDFDENDTLWAAAERGFEPTRPTDLIADTARRLAEGQIIGWMQGRMEYGPRALGNRSILADPTQGDMKERVNARVKFREPFRPFAPSVTLEDATDWFECTAPSPYMLLAFPVRPEARARLPAVTHVDGTARVQTVTEDENPRYHRLIKEFGRLTGVPVLLNTSFNVRGGWRREPVRGPPRHDPEARGVRRIPGARFPHSAPPHPSGPG